MPRLVLIFCAICILLPAQQGTTFSTDVKVVNLLATVRNKHGEIIRNLTKDDFILQEDGRPQTIRYFSQETNLLLTLGLLVDTSLSQRRVLGEERSASYRFLQQVLREDKDLAFVIHFDREVELLQDVTSSRQKLEYALALIETPQRSWGGRSGPRGPRVGGTALYDAVLLASDELMRKHSGRKALIVLSDGVDNASKVSLEGAIESSQRADTLVYSILFADKDEYGGMYPTFGGGRGRGGQRRRMPVNPLDGKKVLQQLSRDTGGGFFEVSKKQPIENVFDRIQEELRNQYSLGYTSDRIDAGPGFRKIRLTTRQKDLNVQTRDGYYPK